MAVEHGQRTEALEERQRLLSVLGTPAPIFVDRPQRNVSEHHDRRRGGEPLHVVGEPGELLGTQHAHGASLQIHDVDERDKMHAVVVERIPTCALAVLAVALEVGLARGLVEEVVLARHIVHVKPRAADDLGSVVKLVRLRKMGDVAGMDHEGRLGRKRTDPGDSFLKRDERIRVHWLDVETDVAVRDLCKRE
jgi:hypothetical protein